MQVWTRILTSAIFMLCFVLLPSTVRLQEQTPQPPVSEPEKAAEEQPVSKPGELIMPGQGRESPAPEPAKAEPTFAKEEGGIYTIKQGDTLWDISNAFLKDPFLWPLIWKVNPYITNPDLIYPGKKLVIPSLAPIERAMESPEEVAEEKVPEAAPEREVAVAPPPVRPKPKPAPEEEAPPVRRKIILPEEAALPLIDKYSMLNAGFVSEEEEADDMIVGSLEPKTIFGYDDIVFIKIRSREDVNVGDKFLIYKPLNKVKHPVTGSNYGRLIKSLGVLRVTAKDPSTGSVSARITLSFDAIEKESLLTPYQEPTLIYPTPQKRIKDVSGYILEVLDGRTINAQTDIVYLDKGTADGVEPGDRFTVSIEPEESDAPKKVVGEVQVFLVKERTATAVVRKSADTLAKGDMVEFKK